MSKNLFDALGLTETATTADVRKAYRRLAREHHPDLVSDPAKKQRAEARFTEMTEAFNTLSNATRRAEYEQSLRQGRRTEDPSREPKAYVKAALQMLDDDDVEGAIRALKSAIHLEPEPAAYYAHLATALERAKRLSDASRAWDEAIQRDPRNRSYYHSAGRCLETAGLRTRARRMYEAALKRDANDAAAAEALARLTDNPKKAGILGGLFKKV